MKQKDAYETANLNEGHKYLGHFAKKEFINVGHNTSGVVDVVSKGIEKVGRAVGTERGKSLDAADAAVAPVASGKKDTTARRKTIDKVVDGDDGSQD